MGMEPKNPLISIGCHVDLRLIDRQGSVDALSIDIVPDEAADYEHGFLGASTPLAKVLMGEKAGVVIPYLKDDIYAIEITEVYPSKIKPANNAAEKRLAKMKKAIRQVEHTSAVVFASSFSGKWGDYDPDSLPATDNQPAEDAGSDPPVPR